MSSLQYPAIPYNRGANDIPPPAENMAIQDQAQRLHNVDEVHYNEIPPVLAVRTTYLCGIGLLSDNDWCFCTAPCCSL